MLTRFGVLFGLSLALTGVDVFGQNLADVMKKLNEIDTKVSGIGVQAQRNEQRTDQLEAGFSNLSQRVDDLANRMNEFDERQRQLVVATSSGDVLDIRGQMQKPPFREALDSAVHEVLRAKTATFTLTNKMPTYQRVLVNRVEYILRPNEAVSLKLSPGTVHTELPSEGGKTWMLGPPNYEQRVDIVPAEPRTMAYYAPPTNVPSGMNYQIVGDAGQQQTYYAPPSVVYQNPPSSPVYVTNRPVYVTPTYVGRPVVTGTPAAGTSVVYPLPATPIVTWH